MWLFSLLSLFLGSTSLGLRLTGGAEETRQSDYQPTS